MEIHIHILYANFIRFLVSFLSMIEVACMLEPHACTHTHTHAPHAKQLIKSINSDSCHCAQVLLPHTICFLAKGNNQFYFPAWFISLIKPWPVNKMWDI